MAAQASATLLSKCSAAPWKAQLQKSLQKNRSLANARYVQLATIKPDGKPANRTIVFRGFLGESNDLTFVTDSRSSKVAEVAARPEAEVCWYFPNTREQYRISGDLTIVGEQHPDKELLEARQNAWAKMSDGGRIQFGWPHPGQPRINDDEAFNRPPPGPEEAPLSTFCLVVLKVLKVDHLQLKANVRAVAELDSASGEWSNLAVNP